MTTFVCAMSGAAHRSAGTPQLVNSGAVNDDALVRQSERQREAATFVHELGLIEMLARAGRVLQLGSAGSPACRLQSSRSRLSCRRASRRVAARDPPPEGRLAPPAALPRNRECLGDLRRRREPRDTDARRTRRLSRCAGAADATLQCLRRVRRSRRTRARLRTWTSCSASLRLSPEPLGARADAALRCRWPRGRRRPRRRGRGSARRR